MRRWLSGLATTLSPLGGCVAYGDAGSTITGEVRDMHGRPLSGVSVRLVAPAGGGTDRTFAADSATSDSTGCLHLHSLHGPGSVTVVYRKEGFQSLNLSAPNGDLLAWAVLAPAAGRDSSRGQLLRLAPGERSTVCRDSRPTNPM